MDDQNKNPNIQSSGPNIPDAQKTQLIQPAIIRPNVGDTSPPKPTPLQPKPPGPSIPDTQKTQLIQPDLIRPNVGNTLPSQPAPDTVISPEITNNTSSNVAGLKDTSVKGGLVGLTGSQLKEERPNLTIGIYIIVFFLLAGFIINFFNSGDNLLLTILSFLNVVLAAGLLLRNEAFRKVLVIISSVLIILYVLDIGGLWLVQNRAHQDVSNARAALSRVESNPSLTIEQQQEINNYQNQINSQETVLNKTYKLAYIEVGLIIATDTALVIYLTRPKVKSEFS